MGLSDRYAAWLHGNDTGSSSEAIFHFMTLGIKGGAGPYDVDDLGRCLRLLDCFPEWRERMPEMVECSEEWAELAPHWSELEASFLREVGSLTGHNSAPETYELMCMIREGGK